MKTITLTPQEHARLDELYTIDGAWTVHEALHHLGEQRLAELLDARILGPAETQIGTLVLLMSAGRHQVFNTVARALSLNTQLDTAYLRLVMKERDWSRPATPKHGHLIEHSHAVELDTEFGRALVWAKMMGNGHALQHIKRVAQRYRSSALGDDFMVVFVSPSRSGEAFAEDNASFMRKVQHIPTITPAHLPNTLIDDEITPDGPYIAGVGWRDHLLSNLPEISVDILRSEKPVRLQAAMDAIRVDGLITSHQLARYFGLKPNDLPGILKLSHTLRTTPTRFSAEVECTFLTEDTKLRRMDPNRLAHYAGTAEMRLRLGLPADASRYAIDTGVSRYNERPDGLFRQDSGRMLALEYDNGTYSRELIEKKLDSFTTSECDVIWGVTSEVRARNLSRVHGSQLAGEVLVLDWAGEHH